MDHQPSTYKLCFYVPATHVEVVKEALFAQGAGRMGNYSCCAWQTLGEGQFMPLAGSSPFLGQHNMVEKVAEYKVEMICEERCLEAAIRALKETHPYEEPAWDVWRLG